MMLRPIGPSSTMRQEEPSKGSSERFSVIASRPWHVGQESAYRADFVSAATEGPRRETSQTRITKPTANVLRDHSGIRYLPTWDSGFPSQILSRDRIFTVRSLGYIPDRGGPRGLVTVLSGDSPALLRIRFGGAHLENPSSKTDERTTREWLNSCKTTGFQDYISLY